MIDLDHLLKQVFDANMSTEDYQNAIKKLANHFSRSPLTVQIAIRKCKGAHTSFNEFKGCIVNKLTMLRPKQDGGAKLQAKTPHGRL